MEVFNTVSLYLHIISGHLALGFGLAAMILKKGSNKHKMSGSIFFYSMLGVSFTGISVSIIKDIPFLLHIAIFVFYQNHAGFRAIKNKSLKPNFLDLFVLLAAGINGVFMVWSLKIVLMVFGAISILLFVQDSVTYIKIFKGISLRKNAWLTKHIGMMIGAYIGTITAFLVVNIQSPTYGLYLWLGPTVLLVPVMMYWQRKTSPRPSPKERELLSN
jgi:hypothetical protein